MSYGIITSFFILILSMLHSISGFAIHFDSELHHHILNSEQSSEPYISNDRVVFSYNSSRAVQMVSLALESEQYKRLHKYKRNIHGVFVLSLALPERENSMRYRVVVDGLWTTDPHAETILDSRGISISSIMIPMNSLRPSPGVTVLPDGSMQFVYRGTHGSRISLVGDFNRWDPYIMPMIESPVYPGTYSVSLFLPSHFRLYRFVVDGKEIVDPVNKLKQENGWREVASILPMR